MALRLSDLPDHIRAKCEAQLAAEHARAHTTKWHLEIQVGFGEHAKLCISPGSTDQSYVVKAYNKYVSKHGSRNIKMVETKEE